MADTHTCIKLHLVFAMKNRGDYIAEETLPRMHSYMAGILRECGHHPIRVGGTTNHVHILFGYNTNQLIPDFVRILKVGTTKFINENRLSPFHFSWQSGYGCFSVSPSLTPRVENYILRQKEHHSKCSLRGEMMHILSSCGEEFDEEYLFDD